MAVTDNSSQSAKGTQTRDADKRHAQWAERFLWVDNPASVNRVVKYLIGLCVVLFVADFIIHRHSYLSVESWYGFYPFAGFVAFTCIVLLARTLRLLILRKEEYYSPNAVDHEEYPDDGLEKLEHPLDNSGQGGDRV